MVVATDLEGTLTDGVLWRAFGRYLQAHGRVRQYRSISATYLPRLLLAKLHLANGDRLRDRWLAEAPSLLDGASPQAVEQMAEWVVEHEFWPKRRPRVLAELQSLREQGHRVILVSGCFQPVLAAFARRIGAEAIGTPLEVNSASGQVRAVLPVNTGAAKVVRLQRALGGDELIAAYGDTAADIPMLSLSRSPVAVTPDAKLSQFAAARGWRVLHA